MQHNVSEYRTVVWWTDAIGPLGQHQRTQCETTARVRWHEGRLALFTENLEISDGLSSTYREEMSFL